MKPTAADFTKAVIVMARTIPFFPNDELAQLAIAESLALFIDSQAGLAKVVKTAITTMREWQGVAELRGLYCAIGFAPADGIGSFSITPGFTPLDLEAAFFERERAAFDRQYADYQRAAKLFPVAEREANDRLKSAAAELTPRHRLH